MADNAQTVVSTERVAVDSLTTFPANPRQGDVGAIVQSLKAHGQYRALVVNARTREVLAGNHTLLALRELGETEALCHFVDVDDEQAKRIVLVDNRANDLAAYDDHALVELLKSLPDLEGTGYDGDALDELLADLEPERHDDIEPMEPPAEPTTKLGDLWVLGEHRLLCGDATNEAEHARLLDGAEIDLVLTDPPYGVGIAFGPQTDDSLAGVERLVIDFLPLVRRWPRALIASGQRNAWAYPQPDGVLAWVHPAGMGAGPWGFSWLNLVLAYGRDPYTAAGLGSRPDTLVLAADRAGEGGHPTIKPLPVWEWMLTRGSVRAGEMVLDPFAGSGSTLIACENLSRRCYAMEIDPGYCDVIVDRWERHTGNTAERSHDGETIEAHA